MVKEFRESGGGDKPVQGGFKACFAADEEAAVRIAHERWPNSALPGELSQVLPSPRHFEQATQLVRPEMVREKFLCGPDPRPHLEKIEEYAQAGFDEVYVANTGPHTEDLFRMYAEHVFPRLR
jgi:G6PDH family F420-dependent oxidoreductase